MFFSEEKCCHQSFLLTQCLMTLDGWSVLFSAVRHTIAASTTLAQDAECIHRLVVMNTGPGKQWSHDWTAEW